VSPEILVVTALRLIVPLSIFRWPLGGGIASLILDAFDCQIASYVGCRLPNYILTDKYFDTYYLTIELIVSRSWSNPLTKNTALALYIWKFIGIVAFQISGTEKWLIIAPNLFEYFFLFYIAVQVFGKESIKKTWFNSYKKIALVLLFILIIKIPQEILLHLWKEPLESVYSWLNQIMR